jgi:hypothetical protein
VTVIKWLVIAGTVFVIFGVGGFALYELLYLSFPRRQDVFVTDSAKQQVVTDMQNAIGQSLPTMDAVELAIAWAAYESNWGSATGYSKANNPYNVTAGSKWTGPTVAGGDTDDSSGVSVPITQQWRQYASLADGVSDTYNLLQSGNSNYKAAFASLQQGDLGGMATALHSGGYFTQDPSTYSLGVQSCLNDVQGIMNPAPPTSDNDDTPTVS